MSRKIRIRLCQAALATVPPRKCPNALSSAPPLLITTATLPVGEVLPGERRKLVQRIAYELLKPVLSDELFRPAGIAGAALDLGEQCVELLLGEILDLTLPRLGRPRLDRPSWRDEKAEQHHRNADDGNRQQRGGAQRDRDIEQRKARDSGRRAADDQRQVPWR